MIGRWVLGILWNKYDGNFKNLDNEAYIQTPKNYRGLFATAIRTLFNTLSPRLLKCNQLLLKAAPI